MPKSELVVENQKLVIRTKTSRLLNHILVVRVLEQIQMDGESGVFLPKPGSKPLPWHRAPLVQTKSGPKVSAYGLVWCVSRSLFQYLRTGDYDANYGLHYFTKEAKSCGGPVTMVSRFLGVRGTLFIPACWPQEIRKLEGSSDESRFEALLELLIDPTRDDIRSQYDTKLEVA